MLPLTLDISSDGTKFQRVGVRTDVFSQWLPWTAELGDARARYIRYSGAPDGYICLSEAEVYAP